MSTEPDVHRILRDIEAGHLQAAEELLPAVYASLRSLAAKHIAAESPGHTLQPTALVHEAYLRLLGSADGNAPRWQSHGHFFAAAARAMRRVLTDYARKKGARKRGGDINRLSLDAFTPSVANPPEELLDLDEAIHALERRDERQARIVDLRIFAGLSNEETAQVCELSLATIEREWSYAKLWLFTRLRSLREEPGAEAAS